MRVSFYLYFNLKFFLFYPGKNIGSRAVRVRDRSAED